MLQRVRERAGRLGVLVVATAAGALVASTAAGAAASVNVSCSAGGAGLVVAVNTVNAAGGGSINLAAGCTYSLTAANNPAVGGNGLPVVVTPITANGKGATIAGNSSNFRIFMVDGSSGGALTLNGVTISVDNGHGPMAAAAVCGFLGSSRSVSPDVLPAA